MLGEPAVVTSHHRRDAQGEALLAEQRVAAVAGAVRPDLAGLGEVDDVLVLGVARPRHVGLAGLERRTHRVQARHELAVSAEHVERAPGPCAVIVRMLTATYAESVSCTPMCAMGEPSGPIENGTTYIVRPRIEPVKSSSMSARIVAGSRQLLFGPACSSVAEQMNVRSSTRATSPGSECAQ